ncbi:hypothetical protein DH2020_019292 [Rehmannia glutinosa]|uniref:Enoyl reductase (ER) domain-containing protein n=1 Tax=Rehmannia glutinosa TaxID=99300 RepID=A0ABR0WQP2_REHGL
MAEVRNKYVVKKNHIDGVPNESDFSICEELLSLKLHSHVSNNVVIVKNLYVSIDPYQINRMKPHSSSHIIASTASVVLPGQAIEAGGVGRVVESWHPDFKTGDFVSGLLHWGEYSVVEGGQQLQKLDTTVAIWLLQEANICKAKVFEAVVAFTHLQKFFASHKLLKQVGSSGITAYGGFFQVCKPKKGEKVFVSAASGSVGILVGQYAKLSGCYVVGCAGTKEKVDLLKEKLGFDDAFNYKEEPNLNLALQRYFPEGIDIYFDNVGGEMLEAAVENLKSFGRIAICGVISEYTGTQKRAKLDMVGVIYKRIRIEGFLCVDFVDIYPEFISTTMQHLQTGKLKAIEDISYGVENIPTAFIDLFHGNNIGKKVVKIAQE